MEMKKRKKSGKTEEELEETRQQNGGKLDINIGKQNENRTTTWGKRISTWGTGEKLGKTGRTHYTWETGQQLGTALGENMTPTCGEIGQKLEKTELQLEKTRQQLGETKEELGKTYLQLEKTGQQFGEIGYQHRETDRNWGLLDCS
jgi:hypothetical protein